MDRIVWDTRVDGAHVTLIAQDPRMVEGNLIEWDLTDGDQTPYGTIRTGAHKDTVLAIHRRMARKARDYYAAQTAPAEAEAPKAGTVRNPTGQQYKGRKYADRYAASLQESWGGEQADGSLLEVVVDTLDTPAGRRYQVICVTTPAAEREPAAAPVPAAGATYTTVTAAADVTDEVMDYARSVVEGWYNDGRIDWEDVWDRMDGSTLNDGTTLDLGTEMDSPAMRKVQRTIRKEFREG